MDQFKEPEKISPAQSVQSDTVESAEAPPQLKELAPGDVVQGRYKVLSILGRGGVGCVYKVEQVLLKKQYALKTLLSVVASDVAWRRFQKEAHAAGRLEHPNLARAVDFGIMEGNQPFLVMDLVEGQTLAEYLKTHTTLTVEAALQIFIAICFGMEYAHKEGVIHRDIKPSNIVLVPSGTGESQFVPKIVDFGIAKLEVGVESGEQALTKTGEVFGTPLYMSPEQCAGLAVDNRSDIYSLGCVLFEALTGAPPFTGQSALGTMMQHSNETQLSLKQASFGLDFPRGLEDVVAKMLAKQPNNRYQSCHKLAEDLIRLQKGEAVAASSEILTSTSKVAPDRLPLSRLYLFLLLIAVIACIAFLISTFRPQPQAPKGAPSGTYLGAFGTNDSDQVNVHFCKGDWRHGRTFYFGDRKTDPNYTFGSVISYRLPNGEWANKQAKGNIAVPPDCDVEFQPSLVFTVDHPTLFRRFKSGDIQGLTFDVSEILEVDSLSFNAAMAYAGGLKGLKALHFRNVPLNVDGLANLKLASMHDLTSLILIGTPVNGNDLSRFTMLRKITTLEFSSSKNASALLKALRGLWCRSAGGRTSNEVRRLYLHGDQLTDDDLSIIDGCDLSYLDINNNPALSDAGLKNLIKLKRLDCLRLDGKQFDRSVLQLLASKLHLYDFQICSVNWTNEEKEQLRRSLPHCQIEFDDDERTAPIIQDDHSR